MSQDGLHYVHHFLTFVICIYERERSLLQLLLKQVFLVEKEDDGCVQEPLVVQNGTKQSQSLVHTILNSDNAHTHTHKKFTMLYIYLCPTNYLYTCWQ